MPDRHYPDGAPKASSPQPDNRSRLTRASDMLPGKPYVYGGETEEPAAVIAARARWRAATGADPDPLDTDELAK
jgi:hypothetical protein